MGVTCVGCDISGVIAEEADTEPADVEPECAEDPGLAQAPEDERLAPFS